MNALKQERLARNWTQDKVASEIRCDPKTVGRWERGEAVPGLYHRERLCALFGMSPQELGWIEEDVPASPEDAPSPPGERLDQAPPFVVPGSDPPGSASARNRDGSRRFLKLGLLTLLIVMVSGSILTFLWFRGTQQTSYAGGSPHFSLLLTYHTPSGKSVNDVEWAPQRAVVACASGDRTVQVVSAQDGGASITYRDHSGWVNGVAWSPNGSYIVSGSADKTVRVWNALDGTTLVTHQASAVVTAVAWSPDGKRIAFATRNGVVQVWNASFTGQPVTYSGHSGTVWWVAWSPDSQYLVSGGDDSMVQVWNATTGTQIYTYRGHTNTVYDVMWSHDGKRILSASADGTVQAWDATTGNHRVVYSVHAKKVQAAAWSPDSKFIVVGSNDGVVFVLSGMTGQQIFSYHDIVTIWATSWSSDGKYFAFSDDNGAVFVWQVS